MKAVYSFKKEFEIDGHEFVVDTRILKTDELKDTAAELLRVRDKAKKNKFPYS